MARVEFGRTVLVWDEVTLRVPRIRREVLDGDRIVATFGGATEVVPSQEELNRMAGEMRRASDGLPARIAEGGHAAEALLAKMSPEDRVAVAEAAARA